MNINRNDLYRIILEEYLKDSGLQISESKVDDLIAHIKGGPRPDWMGDDEREVPEPPEVPKPEEREDSSTYPMEVPPGTDMSDEDIVAAIGQMIQGRDPEHVSELFQTVFAQIPGVEMGDAEEDPETLYSPGAGGRPAISLGPMREHLAAKSFEKILEMAGISWGSHSISGVPGNRDEDEEVDEGHYHDMGDENEVYDVLDPHGFAKMADAELIDILRTDGMEELIVLDGDGDLANREEVIAALKDV